MRDPVMESLAAALVGLGGVFAVLLAVAAIGEIIDTISITKAKERSFKEIRMEVGRHQNIEAPAVATLLSGLLMSVSASYFFVALNENDSGVTVWIGIVFFVGAAVVLALVLKFLLKNSGTPRDLVSDPFAIKAAADEYVENSDSAHLEPAFLQEELQAWSENLTSYSLDMRGKPGDDNLRKAMDAAANKNCWVGKLKSSIGLYLKIAVRYPARFAWQFAGLLLLLIGAVVESIDSGGGVERFFILLLVLGGVGTIFTAFWCFARGNRARVLHRIYGQGIARAEDALSDAFATERQAMARAERLESLIAAAEEFFGRGRSKEPAQTTRALFKLGSLEIRIGRA